MLLLDVSGYQGGIDFKRAKRSCPQLAGVWVKATQGTTYTNPFLTAQTTAAREAGLRVGFYHYASPDSPQDAYAEAVMFAQTTRKLATRRDLRPVLDLEELMPVLQPEHTVFWARHWNKAVKQKTGVGPLFYSYPALIHKLQPVKPIGYGLWLASYGRNDGREYPYEVPKPWRRAVAHQFSSRAKIPGFDGYVDLSFAASLRPLLAHPVVGRL